MNYRKKLHQIGLIMMVFSMIFNVLTVSAKNLDVDSVTSIAKGQPELTKICVKGNRIAGRTVLTYSSKDGTISFSNAKYAEVPVDDRREFMETVLLSIKESGMGTQVKSKAYNFIANQDTSTSAAEAKANICKNEFVDPPIAKSAIMAFLNVSLVIISKGFLSCLTSSTI